tara:strand:- start:108 stop:356 length:249 start_codon:yes stop_codon:yes gene_type:complete
MSKTDLEARKYFEIEVTTSVTMWANSKEEAIEKFEDEYVNVDWEEDPYAPQYEFTMTGKMWEVPFEPEHNWVKLLINEKKEI